MTYFLRSTHPSSYVPKPLNHCPKPKAQSLRVARCPDAGPLINTRPHRAVVLCAVRSAREDGARSERTRLAHARPRWSWRRPRRGALVLALALLVRGADARARHLRERARILCDIWGGRRRGRRWRLLNLWQTYIRQPVARR